MAHMSIPIHHVKIAGPRRTVWHDPEFTELTSATQLVYFYGRYRSTSGRLTFGDAQKAGLGLSRDEFNAAVQRLQSTPYSHVLERRGRPYIASEVRQAVLDRDRTCRACGTANNLSLDHIIPYSRGGKDTVGNLQALCRPCNSRKGARLP